MALLLALRAPRAGAVGDRRRPPDVVGGMITADYSALSRNFRNGGGLLGEVASVGGDLGRAGTCLDFILRQSNNLVILLTNASGFAAYIFVRFDLNIGEPESWAKGKSMFKGVMLSLIVTTALPPALLAKASPPETLARSAKWFVNYDDDACHLSTEFGTGKDKVIMQMTRHIPGDAFRLSLYGKKFATRQIAGKVKLDFGLSGQPIETGSMSGNAGDLKAIFLSYIRLDGWYPSSPEEKGPSITPEQEASVTGVTIYMPAKKALRLEFGSLAKPLAQLRLCQTELVKHWGYDPEVQAALSRPARSVQPFAKWFSRDDYPIEALRNGYNGIVQFRYDVDASGKIAGCRILGRTNPDVFADLTCRIIIQRAKMEPAFDAAGQPVRTFGVGRIIWRLP